MTDGDALWVLPESETQDDSEEEETLYIPNKAQVTYAEDKAIRDATNAVVSKIFKDELAGLLNFDYPQPCTSHQRATFSLDEVDNEELMQNVDIVSEDGPSRKESFIHRLNSQEEVLFRKPPKIVNHYLFGAVLGEGSYGKVKDCLDSRTLVRKAIKIIKLSRLRKIPNGKENVEREITILRRLNHRNVVQLHEVFRNEEKQKLYLVMTYCVGSLQDMLDKAPGNRFPLRQAHDYFTQLIDGLEYLHGQGVVHKDIKPGNLIISQDETVKISDFGVAEEISRYNSDDRCVGAQGTPKFQPPEIAGGHSDHFRGFPVDIWAAGVTLYNFVSGQYPFEGAAILPLYQNIANKELEMPTSVELDASLEDLLHGLLRKNPDTRLVIAQIRAHGWLRKKQPRFEDRVPVPPKDDDYYRTLTVSTYLEQLYSGGPDSGCSSPHPMNYPDEHQENGNATGGYSPTPSVPQQQMSDGNLNTARTPKKKDESPEKQDPPVVECVEYLI